MRMNMLEALSDNIVIDKDKCVYCGICVDTCILDNLRMKQAPCARACPLGVNCQGYVQLIGRGRDEDALRVLEEKLPFPEVLSRLCSQPCETRCHCNAQEGQAVNIRGLKRYLTEQYQSAEAPVPDCAPATGRSAAIVGSGPAGLMAAFDLLRRGHGVALVDAEPEPGGMLRWAVPEFRLPGRVLDREIRRLTRMGVTFQGGRALGRDLSLDELLRAHDAVLVALGCRGTRRLDIPGEELPGVLYALPFLKSVRAGAPAAVGSRVVVVGGGDVAVDCAQTALRLGAQSVVVISLEGESDLPAHPNVVHGAKAEGIVFRGTWGPQAIQAKEGRLEGVRLKKCVSVFDERSNFQPVYDVCQTDFEAADTVIVAIGQTPERDDLEATGLIAGAGLSCDPLTLQAPDGRVFVAGDIHSGPSSVVHAMASGRRAAESIHRLLSGEDLRLGRAYSGPYETEFAIDPRVGSHAPRTENPLRTYHGAGDFAEMEQPLSPEAARREAGRCYSCGVPFGKFRTCWFCLPCEVECPHDALWVEIPYLLR